MRPRTHIQVSTKEQQRGISVILVFEKGYKLCGLPLNALDLTNLFVYDMRNVCVVFDRRPITYVDPVLDPFVTHDKGILFGSVGNILDNH